MSPMTPMTYAIVGLGPSSAKRVGGGAHAPTASCRVSTKPPARVLASLLR